MYRHIAGVDFNHCEKHSNCRNCSEKQQRACEKEADQGYIEHEIWVAKTLAQMEKETEVKHA